MTRKRKIRSPMSWENWQRITRNAYRRREKLEDRLFTGETLTKEERDKLALCRFWTGRYLPDGHKRKPITEFPDFSDFSKHVKKADDRKMEGRQERKKPWRKPSLEKRAANRSRPTEATP